jgi:hypothetical protein
VPRCCAIGTQRLGWSEPGAVTAQRSESRAVTWSGWWRRADGLSEQRRALKHADDGVWPVGLGQRSTRLHCSTRPARSATELTFQISKRSSKFVQKLQLENTKTRSSCYPKFSKLGKIDKFK